MVQLAMDTSPLHDINTVCEYRMRRFDFSSKLGAIEAKSRRHHRYNGVTVFREGTENPHKIRYLMVEAGESKGFDVLWPRKLLILKCHQKPQSPLNPQCGHALGT
jgi:hypothetical protein